MLKKLLLKICPYIVHLLCFLVFFLIIEFIVSTICIPTSIYALSVTQHLPKNSELVIFANDLLFSHLWLIPNYIILILLLSVSALALAYKCRSMSSEETDIKINWTVLTLFCEYIKNNFHYYSSLLTLVIIPSRILS
jgi:hypothetical protein